MTANAAVAQVDGGQPQGQRWTQSGDCYDHVVVTPGHGLKVRGVRQPVLEPLRAERVRIYRLDDRRQRAGVQDADLPSVDAP